jgi:hypothetical protein
VAIRPPHACAVDLTERRISLAEGYRFRYSCSLTTLRLILCGLGLVTAAGCGSQTGTGAPKLDRVFDISWHDRANAVAITYTTRHLVLRHGEWSAEVTVHNGTGKPLYESDWEPPGSSGTTWYGPALVYSGLDVLGNRRLIYLPADREEPNIPLPLADGATWRGTIGGKLPGTPALPLRRPIWLRYPVFAVGLPGDVNAAPPVQWISDKSVQL